MAWPAGEPHPLYKAIAQNEPALSELSHREKEIFVELMRQVVDTMRRRHGQAEAGD